MQDPTENSEWRKLELQAITAATQVAGQLIEKIGVEKPFSQWSESEFSNFIQEVGREYSRQMATHYWLIVNAGQTNRPC